VAEDDYWSQNLLPSKLAASFGDGSDVEFEIRERNVESGQRFARYVYSYRPGQGVEDLGRKIYIWNLRIPLFRGVGVNHYPGTLDNLVKLIERERGELEYQDPEWGPFLVKVADWSWQTVAEIRNGGVLTLVIEERSFDQSIEQNLNKPQLAKRALASKMAIKLDNALELLGTSLPDISDRAKGFSLTEMWNDVQDALDTAALAADDIAARIDEVFLVGQDIYNFSAEDELERWSITNSVADFLGAVEDVGNDSGDVPPGERLVTRVLPDTMSMYDIAMWLYKDPFRAEEIAFNNPVPNVLQYARGSLVKVFAA
jgi:hypothetical protein